MHLETSISLATSPAGAERACGAGVVVADRRLISRDCNDIVYAFPYAFSTFTRKDLNSGVLVLPSPTNGVSVFAR